MLLTNWGYFFKPIKFYYVRDTFIILCWRPLYMWASWHSITVLLLSKTWAVPHSSRLDRSCQHHSNCTDPLLLHKQPSVRPSWDTASVLYRSVAQALDHRKVRKAPGDNMCSPHEKDERKCAKGHQNVSVWMNVPTQKATTLALKDVLSVVVLFKRWSFVMP